MNLVLICGSPRKGNTEWMLAYLHKLAQKRGLNSQIILLRKLNIEGCRGCLSCEAGRQERKGVCRIKDDMEHILPVLLQADAIILGTPVYFSMLSGLLKNFMDRTCPIWPGLKGKYCGGIAVAEEGIGEAIGNLKTYSDLCRMKWIGSVTTLAKTPRQTSPDRAVATSLERLLKDIEMAGRQHKP